MNELDDFIKWIGRNTSCIYNLCPKCEGIKAKKATFCRDCSIPYERNGKKNPFFGKCHTEKSRKKMTVSRTGKKASEITREKLRKIHSGKGNTFYGKKHSEETKIKIGIANGGINSYWFGKKRPEHSAFLMGKERGPEYVKQFLSGKNNPNWRGGLSLEPYGGEFTNELKGRIRARDNFMCQFCGTKENGRKFPIHHIDYEKKNADPVNLITLCDPHHIQSNYNREKWQFFYETYQEIRMTQ